MNIFITGITGQDGSYMAEKCIEQGHKVYGLVRRSSTNNLQNLKNILDKVTLLYGDVTDRNSVHNALLESNPGVIFNFASQTSVGKSFDTSEYTSLVNGIGTLSVFDEALHYNHQYGTNIKVYHASTSEMFGNTNFQIHTEDTPLNPLSPYGIAKTFAHNFAKLYRSLGLHVVCGICNNHSSIRQGDEFVTTKIINHAFDKKPITLGNIKAVRDFGCAVEYVDLIYKIMVCYDEQPDDYVFGTGLPNSIEEFVALAYAKCGLDYSKYLTIKHNLIRPVDIPYLVGNSDKMYKVFGFKPKVLLDELLDNRLTYLEHQVL